MIKGQFTRDQGIEACAQMDLRLAEVNSANFDWNQPPAFICNGNVAQSWIRSWMATITKTPVWSFPVARLAELAPLTFNRASPRITSFVKRNICLNTFVVVDCENSNQITKLK